MKKMLLAYAVLLLLSLVLLLPVSYASGSGYLYILWMGIQIQSTVVAFVLATLLFCFIIHVIFILLKKLLARLQREQTELLAFDALHPYEQLGVVWILKAEPQQGDFIQQRFDQSGLLQHIVQARLLFKQQQYQQALECLDACPPATFELAEIQKIEIYLAQGEVQTALSRLSFLSGQPLSPWLITLQDSYQIRLQQLWYSIAVQYPWAYLQSMDSTIITQQLNDDEQAVWLQQLLGQFSNASAADIQKLIELYINQSIDLYQLPYNLQLLHLKVLAYLPEMSSQYQDFALHLLTQHFNQDLFYLWLQQQLLEDNPDFEKIESHIELFEKKYSDLPILTFARWHIYMATDRVNDAEALLSRYPDNILMNYLRIKSKLKDDESLIKQLNLIFESDVNFIKFKI
ncbi:hypothetical protein [Acinetobacter larvae]|uniref:Heme biosynthesis protein HemY n=1 Tax=Acinetobacter larvae TaxID=1789224 RepID=A0A1B2M2X4_9GAMM|nr:hypothetical protein [Acinetobacter larvae]AOA59545.1 hypothetical protein BFG52_15130 [Acinetobacter larvae]